MAIPFAHPDTANRKDDHWVVLGPGGGGCVHTLTIDPRQPDTMVVSCDMTAGYITHDGGQTWREFNLKSRQYAYAFDPHEAGTLWVGTSGLFRSRDRGVTWQLVFPNPLKVTGETRLDDECRHNFISTDNWPGKTIHAITVDQACRGQVFIGIKKMGPGEPFDFQKPVTRQGILIYASSDDGASWRSLVELPAVDIFLIAIDPSTPVESRALLVFTEKGVYRVDSASGGVRTLALPADIRHLNHASVAIDPSDGETVFYVVARVELTGPSAGATILRSRDLGLTWQDCRPGLAAHNPDNPPWVSQVSACGADARRVWTIVERSLEIGEAGEQVVRYGILRSDDSGDSWQWAVKHDDLHDPANREFGWAERDYGAQWGDIKGDEQISPKGRFAWDVVASPINPQVCYTMDFSTIYATCDGGTNWEQLVTRLSPDGSASSRGIDVLAVYGVVFDPFDSKHVVLPVTDAGIFHSHNSGRTWQHDLTGVPREWINSCYWVVFDPQIKGRAWSAWTAMHDLPRLKMLREELFERDQGGICKSDDGLQTWRPSACGLPALARCTHILLDPTSPAGQRTLYAVLYRDGIYKSTDDGETWEKKVNGIDPRNTFTWRVVLTPDKTLYMVVVKNRLKGQEFPGLVYKSTDGAETWEPVPLPQGVDFPNDLTCDPSGRLYLACWPHLDGDTNIGGGAYASDNGGQSWVRIADPSLHVYTVIMDTANPSSLYMSTFDAALFRSTDRGGTWKKLKGFDFQWGYRPVPDPHHPGMLYMTTFGSSVWYGPVEGVEEMLEDMIFD